MPTVTAPESRVATGWRRTAALSLILGLSACGGTPPAELARSMTREAGLVAASLFAPVGPETRPLRASPLPAAKPARLLPQGIAARNPRTGETLEIEMRRLGGGAAEIRQSDGCIWRTDDWIAPATAWRDCGESRNWHTGRSEVTGGTGLWPLRLGAEGRFNRRATSHTGRRYARETTCRVTDAVEVLRDGHAPTPAFVVDCADGKRVRTTWWAPDQGPVAFRKTHDEHGIEELWVAR